MLGLIATRSIDEEVKGLKELRESSLAHIRSGQIAYGALERIRAGDASAAVKADFEAHKADLGFALLLAKYTEGIAGAGEDLVQKAATDTIPGVAPLFWTFRIMVACGFTMLFIFVMAFYYSAAIQGKGMDQTASFSSQRLRSATLLAQ